MNRVQRRSGHKGPWLEGSAKRTTYSILYAICEFLQEQYLVGQYCGWINLIRRTLLSTLHSSLAGRRGLSGLQKDAARCNDVLSGGLKCGRGAGVLLVQGVSVLFVCALNLTAAAELRFYASFDETFQADLARGSAAGLVVRRGASLAPDGKWGRAVRGQGTSQLAYDVVENLDVNRGTLEFFARFDPFNEQQWKYSLLHVSGVEGMELGVARQGPVPLGLCSVGKMGKRSSWVSNAQRFVYYGTWQHYALTWDLNRGPGQGSVSVFVDGTRRVHVTDLETVYLVNRSAFPRVDVYRGGD